MPKRDQEIAMLRREVEMLMGERQAILRVAGASAALIASLDSKQLPAGAVEAADMVATSLNDLSEETLQDALAAVHAEIEGDAETWCRYHARIAVPGPVQVSTLRSPPRWARSTRARRLRRNRRRLRECGCAPGRH